jgi:hypothetical protein
MTAERPASWSEQSANAEKTRTEAQIAAEKAEAEIKRRELLDAPKIAKAQAEAARITREAEDEAEEARKAKEAKAAEESADAERQAESAERDEKAATAVKWFAIACFLFAMPLQLLAFWEPSRPFMLLGPLVLESAAWVMMRQAEAAITARRVVWHYLVGAGLAAAFAAAVNVWHGWTHPNIGLDFGIVGAFCSLAGPTVWAVHEFGARAKAAKATRAERKIAEAAAKKAEAELAARQAELDHKRQMEADRRAEADRKAEEEAAAEAAKIEEQDERRKELFGGAWEKFERIIAAHPLGAISRDKAWADARRADAHPDVWERYEHLASAAPANVKPGALWEIAWRSVHALPVGQTVETLAAELAARQAVEDVLAAAERTPDRLAVDLLLDDIFPPSDGDENGGTSGRGRGNGGPSGGAGTLGRKGNQRSGRTAPKTPQKPLNEDDLAKVRDLADALRDVTKLSVSNVRAAVGGGSTEYLIRLRDAVKAERKNAR